MVVHPQSQSCLWSLKAVRHLFSLAFESTIFFFFQARGGCLGHASVVLLANEANDHYESFIAPLLLIFLDQIGIENVGFGEKEKIDQNQKVNRCGRVSQEIGTELSSQLQPNMAVNSKGSTHGYHSQTRACWTRVRENGAFVWRVRLSLISELHCKCYFALFFIISA